MAANNKMKGLLKGLRWFGLVCLIMAKVAAKFMLQKMKMESLKCRLANRCKACGSHRSKTATAPSWILLGSLEKYPGIRASEDDPKKSVHRKRPKDAAAGNETSRRNRSTRVEQRVSVVLHVQVLKGRYQRGSLMLAKY
ncbi:hypothetical protein V6N13_137839 [Hibiscus sabdariffa]